MGSMPKVPVALLAVLLCAQGCTLLLKRRAEIVDADEEHTSQDADVDRPDAADADADADADGDDAEVDDADDGDADSIIEDANDAEDVVDIEEEADADEPPPTSCADILASDRGAVDGEYTITVDGDSVLVYCDMTNGGWTQVVRFDITVDGCPGDWERIDSPDACDIGGTLDCMSGAEASAFFESPQGPYDEVRGFLRAYQYHSTDAFGSRFTDIDNHYVDGVSITHSASPRQHIWTLASGLNHYDTANACPCDDGPAPPGFIGSDFFCDTGNDTTTWDHMWYTGDMLWDGGWDEGCGVLGSPAWFETVLDATTEDPIEVRLLQDQCDENIGVIEMELYVR